MPQLSGMIAELGLRADLPGLAFLRLSLGNSVTRIRNEISPILAAWHGWFHLGSCPLSGEAFRFDDLVGAGGDYNGQTVEAPEVPCGDDLLVK